jgi:rare lipoprotein A
MQLKHLKWALTALVMVSLLSCSGISEKDSAPKRTPDISKIPDAVPKYEPKSKYGNPRQYEVFGKTYYPMQSAEGFREVGTASWYGKKFHGRKTSSGEVYDMFAMTAAHKTLPLPTYVQVTNLDNGRKIVVKVNDRGPFHGNRVIDLSYSAASKLGIIAKGTGRVEIVAISPGQPIPQAQPVAEPVSTQAGVGQLYLQVGAYSQLSRAEKVKADVAAVVTYSPVFVDPIQARVGTLYRVRVGPVKHVSIANDMAEQLSQYGFQDNHIVVE